MNTVEFWMGIALGCVLALIIILAIVWFAGSRNSKRSSNFNDRSLIELQRRNNIGRMQCSALQLIGASITNVQETAVEIRDALRTQNEMGTDVREILAGYQATADTGENSLAIRVEHLLDCMSHPPAPNCSCHISAPCNDCADHSALREAVQNVQDALTAYKGGAQ